MSKRSRTVDISDVRGLQTRSTAIRPVLTAGELATECTLSKESATDGSTNLASCGKSAPASNGRKVKSGCDAVDGAGKDYLTESEIARFLAASKVGRHGIRDYCMMLLAYRHGLRVSELIDIRIGDIDMVTARLFVRRKKGSLSTHQPVEGDELRAIRAWLRERALDNNAACSPFLFVSERGPLTRQAINYLVGETARRAKLAFGVHPHMLRHSCGLQRLGYAVDSGLSWPQKHRSHHALHPNRGIPI